MQTSRIMIASADGIRICLTHYRGCGARPPNRAAVILGATGVVQERYAAFARFLAEDGWHVLTFDYRGIGGSTVTPSDLERVSMQAWGEQDLAAVLEWIGIELRPQKLVAIAHSIGGQIIPLARNHSRIQAVLALAVQKGYWKLWSAPHKYLVYGFFRLYIPICLRLFKHVPLGFAGLHRLEAGIARDYARWTLRAGYHGAEEESLNERFAEFRAPILSLSFEDDTTYAPRRTVDFLMQHFYVNAPVLRCHVIPRRIGASRLAHSGFFDARRCPKGLWKEVSTWLKDASLPYAPDNYQFEVLRDVRPLRNAAPPYQVSGQPDDLGARHGGSEDAHAII